MAAGVMPDIGDAFFLVDPLDGTREFIAGRGEFTVNIALVHRRTPVFGLVYAPVTHDLFVTTGAERWPCARDRAGRCNGNTWRRPARDRSRCVAPIPSASS